MYIFSHLKKVNTIIENSEYNTSLNPVAELVYGNGVTRMLTFFDTEKLSKLYEDKVTPTLSKFRHILKMKNVGSVDYTQLHQVYDSSFNDAKKVRATSFDLIFFLIPCQWDGGKGFDYASSFFNAGYIRQNKVEMDGRKLISKGGSNWFQPKNNCEWQNEFGKEYIQPKGYGEGVYSNDFLSSEYDKFSKGEESVIIARQHFDVGTEDIYVDITDTVNKFITKELKNYGIGIAFTPMTELVKTEMQEYVGFFTNKTNTFFAPKLVSIYQDEISDDRANFCLNKKNKLYLYCNIMGNLENLDELPKCSINGVEYEVKHQSVGIYYIDVKLSHKDGFEPNTMYYDEWTNLKYQGDEIDDVELYFTTKPASVAFGLGNSIERYPNYIPEAYGIKDNEKVYRGDVRKIGILARVPYTREECQLVDKMQFRLYVKDGESEIDVIPFDNVNKSYLENYYTIDTRELLPSTYYVDIKLSYNGERIVHRNVLHFDIVNDETHKYF